MGISTSSLSLMTIQKSVGCTFSRNKSEAFETFQKFKVMIEKMTENNFQSLRSDRESEYMSNEFKSYCENHEIYKFLTIPYTPQ
jgi:hypothetical protein